MKHIMVQNRPDNPTYENRFVIIYRYFKGHPLAHYYHYSLSFKSSRQFCPNLKHAWCLLPMPKKHQACIFLIFHFLKLGVCANKSSYDVIVYLTFSDCSQVPSFCRLRSHHHLFQWRSFWLTFMMGGGKLEVSGKLEANHRNV